MILAPGVTIESFEQWNKEFREVTEMSCGADWTQIGAMLGVPYIEPTGDDIFGDSNLAAIKEALSPVWNMLSRCNHEPTPEEERVVEVLRHHVWGMVEYDILALTPVYAGLAQVEDDGAFVGYCVQHLAELWT